MTKQERAKLRTVVAATVRNMQQEGNGRAVTSAIVAELWHIHADTIEAYRDRLISAALAAEVNSCLKRGNKAENEEIQFNLFGNSAPGLTVPKSIAVPSPDGTRELVWVQIQRSTLSEIDSYIDMLAQGISADQSRLKKITVFREQVAELTGGDDMDTPISELLEGLRAKTARAV